MSSRISKKSKSSMRHIEEIYLPDSYSEIEKKIIRITQGTYTKEHHKRPQVTIIKRTESDKPQKKDKSEEKEPEIPGGSQPVTMPMERKRRIFYKIDEHLIVRRSNRNLIIDQLARERGLNLGQVFNSGVYSEITRRVPRREVLRRVVLSRRMYKGTQSQIRRDYVNERILVINCETNNNTQSSNTDENKLVIKGSYTQIRNIKNKLMKSSKIKDIEDSLKSPFEE